MQCHYFSQGPMNTSPPVRFFQPPGHVAIAEECASANKTLNYQTQTPADLWSYTGSEGYRSPLVAFCKGINECDLPALRGREWGVIRDIPSVLW